MKYTMKEIRASLPKEKKEVETFWAKIFLRRASYWLTFPLINIGCSANAVSLVSCFVALFGSALLCINNRGCIWFGIILLNLWGVLDCVDGNIARCTKKNSPAGEFFDATAGYTISAFILVGVGVAAYHSTALFSRHRESMLLVGAIGSICCILSKLIYHKYSISMIIIENSKSTNRNNEKKLNLNDDTDCTYNFLKQAVYYIDYELGVGGDETLLLIIFAMLNKLDIFLILYSVYNAIECAAVFAVHVKKMLRYANESPETDIR